MKLDKQAEAWLTQVQEAGSRVVLALSGGLDSMVLVAYLSQVLPKNQIYVGHFDHGMRPESGQDAAFVADYCRQHGLSYRIGRAQQGLASEAQAREARYEFLKAYAQEVGADCVVTAHHQDDQAETVLMKLIRGASLQGIRGMSFQGHWQGLALIRPFLSVPKAELEAWALAKELPFVQDASNFSRAYARNRLRHDILPLLKAENPQVQAHLAAFARELEGLLGLVADQVDQVYEQVCQDGQLARGLLAQQPPALQERVLAKWLAEAGFLRRPIVEQVQKLLASQSGFKEIRLGQAARLLVSYDWLSIEQGLDRAAPAGSQALEPVYLTSGTVRVGDYRISSQTPLVIRGLQAGDRMPLSFGAKKVARILIDAKIPKEERASIPLVVGADGEVLAILKKELDYLSNDEKLGKIKQNKYAVRVERENNHDS